MKTTSTLFLFVLATAFFSAHSTNYTNTGNAQGYTLQIGDTLRVTNGIYTGNISTFTYGAVIIVSSSATFKPSAINTPTGKIINYGTCEFGALGTYGGFKFENFNLLIVKGNLSLYKGTVQTWINHVAATIKITGNTTMEDAAFTNYATMSVGGNFSLYSSNSNYINRGLLTVTGDVAITDGVLDNENRIVADDFNASGGEVYNEGSIAPKGEIVFSSGTNYTNKCLLITNEGFTNHGNFTNNGMLWVGRTGTANDHFYNSGTFTNAPDAVVRTVRLTNHSTLAGGGGYYITGSSYTSGTVGKSGTTSDSIKVYDVTRTNASRVFDVQWGTVHSNVVYRPFAQPDTNNVNYAGCASYYRTDLATLLPIEWNYFTAKLVQNQPTLSWSAQFEANMKFEVERSVDNINYISVANLLSNTGKQYTFTDEKVGQNAIVYYRIKATSAINGAVKYTDAKSLKISGTAAATTVYPNPVRAVANVQFKSEKSESTMIRISNAAGQQLMSKVVMAAKGMNTVSLTEATQWNPGLYFVEVIKNNNVLSIERFIKQ